MEKVNGEELIRCGGYQVVCDLTEWWVCEKTGILFVKT